MAKPPKKQTTTDLPLTDQVALRLLGYMLMSGDRPHPDVAIDEAYAYASRFLDRARENWRRERGLSNAADAETNESDDAQTDAA